MRVSRILALLAVAVMLVAAGCTRHVAGTAQPDPQKPPVEVSQDGFGVVAGFENAPARIEIFTEPQCPHCADLQADFGDQLAYYIGVGQLKVTYRPLTFLDDETDGHSARVSNALFLAADADATGAEFQRFVEELWAHQQPGGQGPSDDEMAEMARAAQLPESAVKRVATGGSAVNIADMEVTNFQYLYQIDPLSTGTPTVYDLVHDERIDIYDDDWLVNLVQS
ncbi:DsbA family protein [Mycolicibacterium holsaticum]|uniref:DsbA family protein n=1 Tax=Mycolicibacterium holsaticum TaxID=152142 RepID=UPI001C7D368D|nr:thioredoxin domain-containing protein [Mycolicibacterium holsaticum]MDA4110162.1 protein-disulfide isomerase [Mycolicibacterium holsaticum DSM 44478 = JCM 12374]QZA11932.1 thioredoxin domain-containing protein [Mycolicibacterium holsaticum DSM 44478 = JCM 12374]UNC10580.1 thioredoxin domain-containing protein [Mycolicibacterium holsaticum DSM 44478 = JCM 12374]